MDQVAVILPGAGSSAGFVARAFGPALRAAGYALVTPPPEPGPGVVEAALRALDEAAATYPGVRLVGGVSLGAHLAARWAVGHPDLDGVLLALPAWTGAPGVVAAATAASAGTIDRLGTDGALAAAGAAVPWVAAELAAAWPAYGDRLAASLRAAAAAPGPTVAELASLRVPAGLVAFADDPLHPHAVAREWAAALPRAALRTLHLADAAPDPAILGATALAALTEARTTPAR
ncbi:MAG TPA: alpha/beta hydrolase [Mycobacteriales bacterium]|nr:alpha/beta hydrolase [Mycobacteriales bacterium]